MNKASVSCVSLGPGDPELVTIKASRVLREADTIFCIGTQTTNGNTTSRANDILDAMGMDERKVKLFIVPMNKNRVPAESEFTKLAKEMARQYEQGKRVAFATIGDISFYSSGQFVSSLLRKKNIPVQHIAGVASFVACAAEKRLALAMKSEKLTIFSTVLTSEQIVDEANRGSTIVLFKISKMEKAIKDSIALLPDAQFHYFENIGIAEKEFYTRDNEEILARDFPYFSLLIIQKIN